ncbi:calcium-activated chloride channel regulator 1-like [Haliotis cracherodii]|uniref:calcium-activated chloride channel regulator 1-like n=1 Tax=Haliotis cracherodii TaxID=6455 RepID=UPI0039E86248
MTQGYSRPTYDHRDMREQGRIRWAVLMLMLCTGADVVAVTYEDNGYDLLVAINRNVTQEPRIITELQSMFTSASDYLYTTTRKYTYIRRVTILVPDTWTRDPAWELGGEMTFTDADVRVDSPHPEKGNTPYTFQPGQCGVPGRYILLTSDFVLDKDNDRDINYGDAGRVLVHEFAHLRFGVFDEYGIRQSSQHPVYYVDDTDLSLRPTACSTDIKGDFINAVKDSACEPIDSKEVVNKDCYFLPSAYDNKATSSVMYAQFLKEVVHFCESNPDSGRMDLKHNPNAPNRQNKMCKERGTWDIIKEHPDIQGRNPADIEDRIPQFKVVYRQRQTVRNTTICGRRIVLVLDRSGSMQLNFRYFKLSQMADQIIRDILPVGTEVGIVLFSETATVLANMRVIASPADREELVLKLPNLSDYGGKTAIGLGLTKAIKLLKENGKSAENGRIFLISDGEENISPKVNTIFSEIVSSKVVIHTLAYSDAAAKVLQPLSTTTGGQYSFFDESSTSTALAGAAERLLKDVSLCEEDDDDIEIDRRAIELTSTQTTFSREVLIDSTVGNNTRFIFTLSHGAGTEISIEDPDEAVYNSDSSEYNKDEALNIRRFLFPSTKTGTWKYTLKRISNLIENITAVVTSHPRVGSPPFEVETWTSSKTFNFSGDGNGVVVYTYVHQGYAPIINAYVEVEVSRPHETLNITLKDKGILPDNTADDGVYSNYLLGFKSNSRYSMKVTVESVEGQTVIIKSGTALSGRTLSVYQNTTQPVRYERVEAFSRTASPDAIDISGYDETVDQLDPGRVTDLDIAIHNKLSQTVTLSWTAPGDDLNVGKVSKYELRVAVTFGSLRENFTQASKVKDEDLVTGSMDPLPAGSQQMVTIRLPSNWSSDFYVYGLKASDEASRQSELSNLRSITLRSLTIPQRKPAPVSPGSATNFLIWVGVGLGVAVAVAVALVVVVVCIYKRKMKTKGNPI